MPHASEISMPARSTINSRLGISISPCHTQPEDLRVLDRGPENEEIIVERIVKIQSCPFENIWRAPSVHLPPTFECGLVTER